MKNRLSTVISGVLIAVFCLFATGSFVPVKANDTDLVATSARAYELYCVNNGEILTSLNANLHLPMASTTKVMTALLTLEKAAENNSVVEFTDEMIAEGSSMYLKTGEKVTLYDLAVGMLMQSGNDAANAAAIAVAGSKEAFADLMNSKAKELGMNDTHFVTPSGLDDSEHYSTAHDMALLLSAAMENEDFANITKNTSMTVNFTEPEDKIVNYPNHNKLLSLYPDCIGGKTGYTDNSGRCLVTAAEKNGVRLVAVTLDDRDDWDDHIALFDYGFSQLTAFSPQLSVSEMAVVGGENDTVKLCVNGDSVVIPKGEDKKLSQRYYLQPFAYAPIKSGAKAGTAEYSLGDRVVCTADICYAEDVEKSFEKRSLIDKIKDILRIT